MIKPDRELMNQVWELARMLPVRDKTIGYSREYYKWPGGWLVIGNTYQDGKSGDHLGRKTLYVVDELVIVSGPDHREKFWADGELGESILIQIRLRLAEYRQKG